MAVSICFLTVSAMAGVTLAAITTGSVISAPARRAGMSAQPLGGGKRPTCEVLIRVRLRRMFPSSLVSAFDPGHDHTTDCNRTRSGADALGDGYPGGTDPIGVLTSIPAARGSGSLLTCMGLFLSSGCFGFCCQFFVRSGKAVLRPVACDQVPGARGRGQGAETLAELGGLPLSVACVSQRLDA